MPHLSIEPFDPFIPGDDAKIKRFVNEDWNGSVTHCGVHVCAKDCPALGECLTLSECDTVEVLVTAIHHVITIDNPSVSVSPEVLHFNSGIHIEPQHYSQIRFLQIGELWSQVTGRMGGYDESFWTVTLMGSAALVNGRFDQIK